MYVPCSLMSNFLPTCRCRVLTVTGSKASFNHTVHTLFGHMTHQLAKNQVDLLEFDGVANVIEERVRTLNIPQRDSINPETSLSGSISRGPNTVFYT